MSRFYIVENPFKMKAIRSVKKEKDGKPYYPFRYWPRGDSASMRAVCDMSRRWERYSIARDLLWDKGLEVPAKVNDMIDKTEKWLDSWGFVCMQDMPPDFQKVLNDHFWELI
jgi:hypothetical protein